ncbi:hypothetical protein AWB74_07660 [Caballeronia arvi]|uniref:Uncharacterized protein n=1 Tax=Caballeronia arvi TaxID=1777135 RepID=A0A158KYW4_9BURK|nr:hypothetical protein AWB74_07660 [Caballeronia arvi]
MTIDSVTRYIDVVVDQVEAARAPEIEPEAAGPT